MEKYKKKKKCITCVPIQACNESFFIPGREKIRKSACVVDLLQPSMHQTQKKETRVKCPWWLLLVRLIICVKSSLYLLLCHHRVRCDRSPWFSWHGGCHKGVIIYRLPLCIIGPLSGSCSRWSLHSQEAPAGSLSATATSVTLLQRYWVPVLASGSTSAQKQSSCTYDQEQNGQPSPPFAVLSTITFRMYLLSLVCGWCPSLFFVTYLNLPPPYFYKYSFGLFAGHVSRRKVLKRIW